MENQTKEKCKKCGNKLKERKIIPLGEPPKIYLAGLQKLRDLKSKLQVKSL